MIHDLADQTLAWLVAHRVVDGIFSRIATTVATMTGCSAGGAVTTAHVSVSSLVREMPRVALRVLYADEILRSNCLIEIQFEVVGK